jgi:hypothetical protein
MLKVAMMSIMLSVIRLTVVIGIQYNGFKNKMINGVQNIPPSSLFGRRATEEISLKFNG